MHYIGTMCNHLVSICNHFILSAITLHYLHFTQGSYDMAEPYLKNRRRFTSSLENRLVPLFDELAKTSRIPKSRLLDEAIEDLLLKHGVSVTRPSEREGD